MTIVVRSLPNALKPSNGLEYIALDRRAPGALETAINTDFDLLVDCICFDRSDAEQLVELSTRFKKICVISTMSVYMDLSLIHI